MIRRRNGQASLWDTAAFGAPDPRSLMDPTLKRIDELLDDEELVDRVHDAMRGLSAPKTTKSFTPLKRAADPSGNHAPKTAISAPE